jgi:hypothetical protein
MITRAREGQCLVDVALEVTGAVEGAWTLALQNGLSLTVGLEQGQEIAYEADSMEEARVASRYASEGIHPATAVSESTLRWLTEGEPISERIPAYEDIRTDDVVPQSTRASIFTEVFTATFA